VVDLDGTLTATDTLHESVLRLLKQNVLLVFMLAWWLMRGRSGFKARVADRVQLDVAMLPWCAPLLDWVRAQRAAGRRVVLATAADSRIAQAVAEHLKLFDAVLASDASRNLKGVNKLQAIRQLVGRDFAYAGDHAADLPIWLASRGAILVGVRGALAASVEARVPVEARFHHPQAGPRVWLKALRVHQWIKNLLLFVPLFTAFAYAQPGKLGSAMALFLSFSLVASATYLMNDLWDLDSDRRHPRKRERPMACGRISVVQALAAAGLLAVVGLGLAWAIAPVVLWVVAGYMVLTSVYSWVLKTYVLIDVLALSALYTYRVLAGGVATDIAVSPWLLAFSVFTFFSLALVKRCSELVSMREAGQMHTRGRDYRVGDLVVLWPLGVASSMCALVVFGLYVSTPETMARFAHPQGLWLVAMGLLYWFGRVWIKTSRGEMHDDPIVFALRDRGSLVVVVAMIVLVLLAYVPL
jgi:4-hydroxybenzoate polyprenyltransferase/phosphoserine phosphatase